MSDYDSLIQLYSLKFGDVPPIIFPLDRSNRLYLNLVKKAIDTNHPLRESDLEQALANANLSSYSFIGVDEDDY